MFLLAGAVGPALLFLLLAVGLWGLLWAVLEDGKRQLAELHSRLTPP